MSDQIQIKDLTAGTPVAADEIVYQEVGGSLRTLKSTVTTLRSALKLEVLLATGAVDDSNTTFTFASEPTVVVINGATYRHGRGVSISGATVTTSNPVGTGGDIYGLI